MSRNRLHAGGNLFTTTNQGGGSKKAGLVPTATSQMLSMPFAWRSAMGGLANRGNGRGTGSLGGFYFSTTNQIGGVGRARSMTQTPSDGVNFNYIRRGIFDMIRTGYHWWGGKYKVEYYPNMNEWSQGGEQQYNIAWWCSVNWKSQSLSLIHI